MAIAEPVKEQLANNIKELQPFVIGVVLGITGNILANFMWEFSNGTKIIIIAVSAVFTVGIIIFYAYI